MSRANDLRWAIACAGIPVADVQALCDVEPSPACARSFVYVLGGVRQILSK